MSIYNFNKFNENKNIIAAEAVKKDGWNEIKFTDDEFYYDFFKKWYLDKHYLGMEDNMEVYVDTIETDYYDYDVIIKVDRKNKVIYTKELEHKYKITPRDKSINIQQEISLRVSFLEQVWMKNRVENYEIKDGIIYVYVKKDRYNNYDGSCYMIDKNGEVHDVDVSKNEDYIFDTPMHTTQQNRIYSPSQASSYKVLSAISDETDSGFRELLNKIADKIGVKIAKFINNGSMGYTFLLSDDRVLKITNDAKEVINTAYLYKVSKEKGLKHVVQYHDIYLINFIEHDLSIYAIIMDKITPLTVEQTNIYDKYIYNIFEFISVFNKTNLKKIIVEVSKFLNKASDNEKPFIKSILDMITEFYNKNIEFNDLHSDNIGVDKNNNIVAFDNGYFTNVNTSDVYDFIKRIDLNI